MTRSREKSSYWTFGGSVGELLIETGNTFQPKWIRFEPIPFEGKTCKWEIFQKEGIVRLGEVKWWNAWRRYCFFPEPYTLYEQDCLWDIADFVAHKTKEYKAQRKGIANL
jgi:hypothetical protein